jgi:hypothetical protein
MRRERMDVGYQPVCEPGEGPEGLGSGRPRRRFAGCKEGCGGGNGIYHPHCPNYEEPSVCDECGGSGKIHARRSMAIHNCPKCNHQ